MVCELIHRIINEFVQVAYDEFIVLVSSSFTRFPRSVEIIRSYADLARIEIIKDPMVADMHNRLRFHFHTSSLFFMAVLTDEGTLEAIVRFLEAKGVAPAGRRRG